MDCESRIDASACWKQPRPCNEEIRNVVALSVGISNRRLRIVAHDGAAHDMHGRLWSGPDLLGASRLENCPAFLERGPPQSLRFRVLVCVTLASGMPLASS